MKPVFVLSVLFILANPVIAYSQLTIEEHLGMENISNPKIHGTKLLYAKTTKDGWDGKTSSSIIVSDLTGKNVIELTQKEYDYNPKWSPNGRWISFVSYRNNLQQIYIVSKEGNEPKMVSDAQSYISNYGWLDENTILYVDDEPRDSLLVNQEQVNGGGYWVGTEFYTNALWAYDINNGTKRKITDGSCRIIDFDVGKNGKRIAYVAAKNYDTYESITNSWIEVIEVESGNSLYKFKKSNAISNPRFSPSGTKLAFVGSTEGYASNDALYVVDIESRAAKNLTFEFDPTIEKLMWVDDDNISFSTPKNGHTGIYNADLKGTIDTILRPYWVVYNYQLIKKKILISASRGSKPKQLYFLEQHQHPENASQLTHLNTELNSKIKTTTAVLNYLSYDGTKIQGTITYPPKYDSKKKYPLMTIPHGGPDAVVVNDFNWMGQFFADNGYVVFQPNFRGSIGYGREFYAGNRNSFGENDFKDIMAGIDKLIELNIADSTKLVIGGWSYGGYMANWAITQTNRFKAAISVAGVSNLVSLYGQHEFSNRDIGVWEYQALPIDNIENYRRASPIFFVKNVETPLLLLHGSNDNRSPTLQAWEMYRAMQDADKEVEMMLYPRAGHSISNPIQFKSVLRNWLKWANKHIEED